MKKALKLVFAGLFPVCIFLLSCAKEELERTPLPKAPSLTGVSTPSGGLTGPKFTIITFTGTDLVTDLAKIEVKVNGKACEVLTATSTTITARIPANCGSGSVILYMKGTAYPAGNFNYIYSYEVVSITNGIVGVEYGPVATAKWEEMVGLDIDAAGNFYIGQFNAARVTKINAAGVSSLVAGSGVMGHADGNGASAQFGAPEYTSMGPDGNLYVAENGKVRKIDPSGNVTTLYDGITNCAYGIKARPSGIYIANNSWITKISYSGAVIWRLQSKSPVFPAPPDVDLDGDTSIARFRTYGNIEVDASEQNIYFINLDGNRSLNGHHVCRIKKLNLPTHTISTIAGATVGAEATDGPAMSATFYQVQDLRLDAAGDLWIADFWNHRVRLLKSGNVTTIIGAAGSGDLDGSTATAKINRPSGLAFDASGNLYFNCLGNNKLKKLIRD